MRIDVFGKLSNVKSTLKNVSSLFNSSFIGAKMCEAINPLLDIGSIGNWPAGRARQHSANDRLRSVSGRSTWCGKKKAGQLPLREVLSPLQMEISRNMGQQIATIFITKKHVLSWFKSSKNVFVCLGYHFLGWSSRTSDRLSSNWLQKVKVWLLRGRLFTWSSARSSSKSGDP